MSDRYKAGILGVGFDPLKAPNAPTIGAATAGNAQVSVAFTAPADAGGSAISSYRVLVTPGGFGASGTSSPITVTGLTNGTAYTFSVAAVNSYGFSPYSGTVSGTPAAPPLIQDVFATTLYTGNTVNFSGGGQSINTGLNMSSRGGLVWCKSRSATGNNVLCNVSNNIGLYSNLQNSKFNGSLSLAQYYLGATSTGFNLPADNNVSINTSGVAYVSWSFCKAPKFFDSITWTGTGSAISLPHNLEISPGCVFIKRTDSPGDWGVWHRAVNQTSDGAMILNSTAAKYAGGVAFGAGSSSITVYTGSFPINCSESGANYVAYLFAHDTTANGMIQCGSFNSTGQVTLGWEPQWLLMKSTSETSTYIGDWRIFDNQRGVVVGDDAQLFANTIMAENTGSYGTAVVFNSTGFLVESQGSYGTNTIYIAIRKGPMS